MRYINTKTGAIIDSSFPITGTHWECLETENEQVPNQTDANLNHGSDEEIDLTDFTKEELIAFAQEHNIEIKPLDKKQVILDTIVEALS